VHREVVLNLVVHREVDLNDTAERLRRRSALRLARPMSLIFGGHALALFLFDPIKVPWQ